MKFGVIGGNGVAATNRLQDMIERKITEAGAVRDQHHPEIIVWQATQAPSRSMFLEGRGPSFVEDYAHIAESLRNLGADMICMCCNTAHYCIEDIQNRSGVPFINLLEVVARRARVSGEREFEIFVTDGARKFRLYDDAFARIFPEARLRYPDGDRQRLVTSVISGVKTAKRFLPDCSEDSPRHTLRYLVETAAAPVILGCTDLRVAYKSEEAMDAGVLLDSLECLADEIIAKRN